MGAVVGRTVFERVNLIVERGKMNRLRRELRARSNSEAVRMAIDRELAITGIQDALRGLRERGTLEDVFRRAPSRRRRSSALKPVRRA
jgi:hypothetical protein